MTISTEVLTKMLIEQGNYTAKAIERFAALNDMDPVVSFEDWKITYCQWAGIAIPLETKPQKKKPIKQSLRTKVFERDAYRCRFCGDWHGLTVDHIIPESRGGTLDFDNLQTLCKSCNSKKGNK